MYCDLIKLSKNISVVAIFFVLVFVGLFLTTRTTLAATNITSTAPYHWAWNDSVGWIDFYNTNSITVASNATTTGYASSTVRAISLDCAWFSVCGTANYGVYNPGNGNLAGWAWNDVYGWISFCGGQGTINCPGAVPYEVLIDTNTGDFTGWAWNDIIGWISFNCADLGSNFCQTQSNYKVNTDWKSTASSGYLDSSTYDTGATGGAELNSIIWQGDNNSGATPVKFQIAASNSSSGPWNFIGYDGTSNTYYPQAGLGNPGNSISLDYVLHNNQRYFRYRVFLYSDTGRTKSPRVDDVIVNWSP